MKKICSIIFLLVICCTALVAQEITGNITGQVIDLQSEIPIPFASIGIIGSEGSAGTSTDEDGKFILENIPVGRHQIQVSYVGYETAVLNDVLVTSTNNPGLLIKLQESIYNLEEVVVRPKKEKEKSINQMATVSAKQLNMEEANRFAGGFDDPARLVTSFAGVASGTGDSNAFSVRGNSPKGTLWQIEGIPVPNPNHFGEITGFGGGGITALSSKTIGNSDFFMGAFPAEYGNALSSVFDLNIRKGNSNAYHHSLQVGFFGLDVASEGPFKKGTDASYLFNYRYSTLGLFGLGLTYQDLSFKIHLPTEKAGTFSIWGLGLIDATESSPDPDTMDFEAKWQYYDDISTEKAELSTGVVGLSHKIMLGKKSFLKTTATAAVSDIFTENSRLDSTLTVDQPINKIAYQSIDYRLGSTLNTKFGAKHTNRTGLLFTNLNYDFDLQNAVNFGEPLTTFAADNGASYLAQAFTQSTFNFGKLKVNPGVHFLLFGLNNNYSIEPRLAVDYALTDRTRFAFGYGLHSQVEKLSFYLADIPTEQGIEQLNKTLGLGKSHHFVLAFDQMLGEYTHFRIEPYYQYLFDVPVIPDSYFSTLNIYDDFFINEALVNEGTGQNLGIDITLERFLNKGFYYLATLSLFDSKYVDGFGNEKPARFNRQLIGNFLVGKEWLFKDKNLFSANVRYTYLGGNWTHPIDETASLATKEIIEDFSNAFTIQNPGSHIVSFTLSYRVNRKKYSSLWSLQVLNVSGAKEYLGYQYNFREGIIEENTDVIVLPNLSYKIEF